MTDKLVTPGMTQDGKRPGARVRAGERNDLFFAAVETTRMPMVVTDPHQPDNPIIFCNLAFQRLTGYTEQEIVGRNCRFLQGPETDREQVVRVARAIEREEEIALELLNYRKNGSTFWNALFISPVYDTEGRLVYFFASQLDVSRRREAEEALRQAQKMEAVGKLTGGIAHDFNNLLQVVSGYSEMLERKIDPNDRGAVRAIEAINKAAQRGATLTQQLLAFARKQELRERVLNMNQLVEDFRPILEKTLGDRIDLRIDGDQELWNCRIDPVQAEMALLNIAANARDAMDGQGRVSIRTYNAVVKPDELLADRVAPGEFAAVEIADSGGGIEEGVIDQIFDPFFSTKEVGKGTGLGLAMVYGFMRQSGGAVTARNGDGGGAVFTLYLPHAGGRVDPVPVHASGNAEGEERILLVEDQEDVAQLATAILEELGYTVVHVDGARKALGLLDTAEHGFNMLLSDIVMPGGMNGVELATEVRRRYPQMPILLATGFASKALEEATQTFELIHKPFRAADLGQRVRMLLDGPNGVS